jgi:hypothetical protein
VAIVAHVAAFSTVAHLDVAARTAPQPHHSEPELEVEVDDLTSVPPSPALLSAEPAPPASGPESARGVQEAAHGSPTQQPPGPTQSAPTEPSGDTTWTFLPTTAGSAQAGGPFAGHALEAAVHAGVDAILAQERREEARRHIIVPVIIPHEIEVGLAPGGGLASLGEGIVRRSRVPEGSQARLQFDTNAAGVVVASRVLDVSSAWLEWEEVARAIATASREKPSMRVPPGWRGVAITLDASCELRSVDGDTSRDLFDKATHVPLLRVARARVVDVTVF